MKTFVTTISIVTPCILLASCAAPVSFLPKGPPETRSAVSFGARGRVELVLSQTGPQRLAPGQAVSTEIAPEAWVDRVTGQPHWPREGDRLQMMLKRPKGPPMSSNRVTVR